mmetsp:Transcript_87781/g.142105  ORF Transcript_87781/g.142105 Transcript_87781/m.142105 type:complete len:205 (-) Transcript_87781:508-1122(-)
MEGGSSAYLRFERNESSAFNYLHLNLSFLRFARCGAIGVVVCIWMLPLISSIILVFPVDFAALYVVAGLVSAIELPFCCSFLPICRKVQVCLAPVEIYWLRGSFYIILSAILIIVNRSATKAVDIWSWLSASALLVVGILYVLAYCNGERRREWEQEMSEGANSSEDQAGGMFGKLRNMMQGASKDTNADLQRAALRAAMSTAM